MGRREPARLRRVPARVVAQLAAVRDHARPARSCSSGGRPGAPGTATSARSTSSRSPAAAMEELLAGPRARACRRRCATRSSRAPRASRSTRSRRCGCCSTAACSCRRARSTGRSATIEALEVPETLHALIAARLDGLAPEERRLLQDAAVLGKTFTRAALAALAGHQRGGARAAARRARPQGGARRPGRPALARARPVRLPPGPRPPRRLRDALEARAPDPPPRRRRVPRGASPTTTRSSRSSPPTTSPPTRRRRTPTTRPRSGRRPRRCSPAPASAPRRSARPPRRSATSSRRRGSRTTASARAALLDRAGEMAARAGDPDPAPPAPRRSRSRSTSSRATRTPPPASCRGSGCSTPSRAVATRRWRGWSAPSTSSRPTSPTRTSPCSPRGSRSVLVQRRSRARSRAGRARARHRRGARLPASHLRSPCARSARSQRAVVMRRRPRRFMKQALEDRARARPRSRTRAPATSSSPTSASGATATPMRSATSTRRSRSRASAATGRTSGRRLRSGRTRSGCWAAGTRRWHRRRVHPGADRLGRRCAQPAPVGDRDLRPARRARRGAANLLDVLAPRRVHRRPGQLRLLASRAALHRAEGRLREALLDGEATIETARTLGIAFQAVKRGIVEALEAAFALGESATVEELLTTIESDPTGSRPPYLDAQARRFRARLAGDAAGFRAAAARFRELEIPFWLAVTLLEAGGEPGLAEAREIFERLEATPWLERVSPAASEGQLHVPA